MFVFRFNFSIPDKPLLTSEFQTSFLLLLLFRKMKNGFWSPGWLTGCASLSWRCCLSWAPSEFSWQDILTRHRLNPSLEIPKNICLKSQLETSRAEHGCKTTWQTQRNSSRRLEDLLEETLEITIWCFAVLSALQYSCTVALMNVISGEERWLNMKPSETWKGFDELFIIRKVMLLLVHFFINPTVLYRFNSWWFSEINM